jgi:hypothetical protein
MIDIHDDRARGGGKIITSVGNIINMQPGKKTREHLTAE